MSSRVIRSDLAHTNGVISASHPGMAVKVNSGRLGKSRNFCHKKSMGRGQPHDCAMKKWRLLIEDSDGSSGPSGELAFAPPV